MTQWVDNNDEQWVENNNDQWYPVWWFEYILLTSAIIQQINQSSSFKRSENVDSNIFLFLGLTSNIKTQIDTESIVDLEDV